MLHPKEKRSNKGSIISIRAGKRPWGSKEKHRTETKDVLESSCGQRHGTG